MNDAYGRAVAVYGPFDEWFINDGNDAAVKAKRMGEPITEFMKVSKTCGTAESQGCFTSGVAKTLNGENDLELDKGTDYYKIITADGMSVSFHNGCGADIRVDIDGPNSG